MITKQQWDAAGYLTVKDFMHARIEIEFARHEQRAPNVTLTDAAGLAEKLTRALGEGVVAHLGAHITTCVMRARGGPETQGAQDTQNALRQAFGASSFDAMAKYMDVLAELHLKRTTKRSTALRRVAAPASLRARSLMTGRG